MDSYSTLFGFLFLASTFSFFLTYLAERSLSSVRTERAMLLSAEGRKGSESLVRLQSSSIGSTGILYPMKFLFLVSSAICGSVFSMYIFDNDVIEAVVVLIVVLGLLVLIHILASIIVSKYGEMIALAIGPSIFWLSLPLRRWFFLSRNRGFGIEESILADEKDSSDFKMSLDSDGEPLDEHEVRMIRGVVRLDKTTAREIMVPRVDMVATELGTNIEVIAEEMVSRGHSRIPVYEGSLDQVRGIAYSRDILAHLSNDGLVDIGITTDVIRPALFIPETKNLEELLSEFQRSRVHMAIVVDEYGGVSGLVTIEDLLEEIVGEIHDEFDIEDPEVVSLDTGELLMDAGVSIDQLFDLTGVNLEGDGYDTVGGFLYERLGKIPKVGDLVVQDLLSVEVVSASGRRLKKLRVTKKD